METSGGIRIFAGQSGTVFAEKMCAHLGIALGRSDTLRFSDGNTFVRIGEKVRGDDIYIVQPIGLAPNDEFMELLFWVDAFKRASAGQVTAIVPYFGYAKGDKKDEPRVSIRARVCADCLEAVGIDRIIVMDLHSPQIQGFFKKPVDHLFGLSVLSDAIRQLDFSQPMIVSPDAGFAKNARKFAVRLGASVAIGDKTRDSHSEAAEILEIIGNVAGRDTVIVDDFTVSCGTLVDMARALKQHGASRIAACVTHAVLSADALHKLEESPIEQLIVTDTIANERAFMHPKVTVVSVAPLFADAVRIIHERDSLSRLFE